MLVDCPECTTRYTPDAPVCPHCGHPNPLLEEISVVDTPAPAPRPVETVTLPDDNRDDGDDVDDDPDADLDGEE